MASDDAGSAPASAGAASNWVFDVGYRDPGDDDDVDISEELHAGLGYASPISDRFDWITEVAGTFYGGDDIGYSTTPIDLTTGGRLWLGDGRTGRSTSPCAPT